LGAISASLATFLQYFGDYSLLYAIRGIQPVDTSQVADGWQRAIGLMQSPNVQAYPYLLVIPLLVALLFSGLRRWIKIALSGGLMICFLGLVITFSRSGYIGVVVGLAWLGFMLPAKKSWRLVVLAGVLVCLTFLLVPASVQIERFLTIPEQLGGEADRSIHYAAALESTIENPILGGGSSAFGEALWRRGGGEPDIPHSNLLIVLVDSGLVGLGAILWFLIRYIRLLRRGLISMAWSPMKYCLLGTCAGLVAFMAQGLFVPNMGWSLLWSIGALPACCTLVRENANLARPEEIGPQSSTGAQ
jgi:O-antigen ligase